MVYLPPKEEAAPPPFAGAPCVLRAGLFFLVSEADLRVSGRRDVPFRFASSFLSGQSALALHHFEKEAGDFPFSALNAGLRLGCLQKNKGSAEQISGAAAVFKRLMEMRKLKMEEFPKLLREPALDDAPLVK